MKFVLLAAAVVGGALLNAPCIARHIVPDQAIPRAVADPARPEADRARDAERKPAQTLAFAGVHSGEHVAELLPGAGYFTRLFSAVVGPHGKVYAFTRPRSPTAAPDAADPGAPIQALAADAHYSNVSASPLSVREFAVPEPVDMVWTSQNYHDLHNIPNTDVGAFDKAVFNALKPGGVFIVLDHVAAAGSGFRDTATLHRIDPEAVRKEVEAAGFKFEGESTLLHNAADDHTLKVFDDKIRGKTDQFILKFRKPK